MIPLTSTLNKTGKKKLNSAIMAIVLPILIPLAPSALAGAKLDFNEDAFLELNLGLKASMELTEEKAPNGEDNAFGIDIESARFYFSGQVMKNLTFEFTMDYSNFGDVDNNGDLQLVDAAVNYQISELLNVRAGRFLRPGDRANQAGPYFSNNWDYPVLATLNGITTLVAGRDEGVIFWGETGGGKFKYQAGIFEGVQGGSNDSDSPLFAGRLEYNFWDADPGFYSNSAHYGEKDILSLGVNYQVQDDAVGSPAGSEQASTYAVDLLMEKVLGNGGVASIEAGYYDYDYNDLSELQGDAYLVSGGYLFPAHGHGSSNNRFQILARHQKFEKSPEVAGVSPDEENQRDEIGLHYIMKAHSAKLSLVFANEDINGDDFDQLRLGVQIQTF